MENPLVSIIMPVHNSEAFLAQTINSVLEQTYINWELIIIDDCSEDDSPAIAQRYEESDKRIRCYRNMNNMGAAASRNKGIEYAKGEWIAFLDSDDLWRNEKLDKQLTLAKEQNSDLIYSSYALFFDDENNGKRRDYLVPSTVTYLSLLEENYIGCSTVLIKKEALAGKRFSPSIYHEDYALWLNLLRSGIKASGNPEILVDWRISPKSRSANKMHAAKHRWYIYRNIERLSIDKALRCFAIYTLRGLLKRYTGYKTDRRAKSE